MTAFRSLASSSYHVGSAETLPSKARALLDRHSYYSAGVRAYDNQRPRDFTVTGERRDTRTSAGSSRLFRHRTVRPSHELESQELTHSGGERLGIALGSGSVHMEPEVGVTDRSGELERVAKVKQVVKMVMSGQGDRSRRQLERSFRRMDKDTANIIKMSERKNGF